MISTNLAEKLAMTVTELPYRVTAEIINSTCGQSISAGGVWNVIQRLGERISEEEEHAVKQMNAGQAEGKKEISVLFEEMDGVWLNMQDVHHKKMKKQEMKVFTMYEGWDAEREKQNRSPLVEKTMLAGMEKSREFHEKRESCIRKKSGNCLMQASRKKCWSTYRYMQRVWKALMKRTEKPKSPGIIQISEQ